MKKSLCDLLNEKKVIIPIIQRDYAQGRNNDKALAVRSRLIDDWKDILLSDNKQMDFNYVYGNENQESDFFPVDGQQRLTSLYLLYWYFSFCNSDLANISKWSFEYKTRNSASEFFEFLRNIKISKELFEIIKNKNGINKEEEVKDKNWFKIKWGNDPTITAAITFLILLSEKMKDLSDNQEKHVWERLNETNSQKNAIVFTYLPEPNCDNPEVAAAKKYTRMNARGKKLTDFENLKAMVDEIESCVNAEKPLSISYDKIYIHQLYKSFAKIKKPLEEIVSNINEESLKWYKMTFLVYSYSNSLDVPSDLYSFTMESSTASSDLFENRIYKISQKRINEPQIQNYLTMMQAVQEVLYNSEEDVCLLFSDFESIKTKIAFIVFVAKLWAAENSQTLQQNLNISIFNEWKRFINCLQDLAFEDWKVSYAEFIQILNHLCKGINDNSRSVNNYFFSMTESDKEQFGTEILPDFYSRLTEQQIKSSLLRNKQINDYNELSSLFINNHRLGYFYYITGCLDKWNETRNTVGIANDIIQETKIILENIDFDSNEFIKGYAYASQCNESGLLKTSDEINSCNNHHIWKVRDLNWTDIEYQNSFETKEITLNNFKKLCNLLKKHLVQAPMIKNQLLTSFIQIKISELANSIGYESCWLRFALNSQNNTKELLTKELETLDGEVLIDSKNYILFCYLTELNYKEGSYLDVLKKQGQIIFTMDIKKFKIYGEKLQTLSFPANPEDDGKYKHSSRSDLEDLSGNVTIRNLDLKYINEILYKHEIQENVGTFELNAQGDIYISLFSLGGEKDKKRVLKISSAIIKSDNYKNLREKLKLWEAEFGIIKNSPVKTNSWDRWIELWYKNSAMTFQFTNNNLQNTTLECGGTARRPMRSWKEITDLYEMLEWKYKEILF